MNTQLKTFILALIVASFPLLASTVKACRCAPISPCEADARATVVFTGTVTKTAVEPAKYLPPSNAMSTSFTVNTLAAYLKIDEAFRGIDTTEIRISGGGTTCDQYFEQGKRYLVYAYKNSDGTAFYTHMCSGTKLISEAKEDFDYLRRSTKLPPGGTILGNVRREVFESGKEESSLKPIPKAKVILENENQRFQAIADINGAFEINGLPKGKYKIYTDPPTNFSGEDVTPEEPHRDWEIKVPERGCYQTFFTARPEGEISGMIVDDSGVVPEDLEPELFSIESQSLKRNVFSVRPRGTNDFKFTFLPPGKYYLGFNILSGPSLDQPYPEFYYPGVAERAKATIITLKENQKITELYVDRPMRLAERMLRGVAVYPNGRAASGIRVELNNPRTEYTEGNSVETDNQGRFSIKAIEGQTYELSALVHKGTPLVNSKPIKITVGVVNQDIKLVVELP